MTQRLAASRAGQGVRAVGRSRDARELLAARMSGDAAGHGGDTKQIDADESTARPAPTTSVGGELAAMLNSPLVKSIAGRATTQVMRGLMGALLGPPPRRRRRSLF